MGNVIKYGDQNTEIEYFINGFIIIPIRFQNNFSTPLHVAASYGFLDIAKMLVFRGAETDSRDIDQVTPMHR